MESIGQHKTRGHLDFTDKREYPVCNKPSDYNFNVCICRNWGRFEYNLGCGISSPLKHSHGTVQFSSGCHKHTVVIASTLEELWFNNPDEPYLTHHISLSFPLKAKQKLKNENENSFLLHSCFRMAAATTCFSSHREALPLRPSWQPWAFDNIPCGSCPQPVWRP